MIKQGDICLLLYLFIQSVRHWYLLKNLILTLVFFKSAYNANPGVERYFAKSSLYNQDTYF